MSCKRVYDFIRGLEVRLVTAPLGARSDESNGVAPALSFLRPGQEARDQMRRHERMLMTMARSQESAAAATPGPHANGGSSKRTSKPAEPEGG